jgi:hypothetical protein
MPPMTARGGNNVEIPTRIAIGCAVFLAVVIATVAYLMIRLHYHG